MRCTGSTVLSLVLFVTYIGIGALAHDTPFQPGLGLDCHAPGLGGAGADHPDLDARLRRDHRAGRTRGDRERNPAVSDGGIGACR